MRTFKSAVDKFFTSPVKLGEVLISMTKMDPLILTDAAAKGAVWLQKNGKGKILKARSMDLKVEPKDLVTFYYEPHILKLPEVKNAECLFESKNYGLWIKDVGVVSQGSQSGDHSSLLRYVELVKKKDVYLIHRLDRETRGIMIVGYSSESAAKLSELFVKNQITKTYEAIVKGELTGPQTINHSLDGKMAITHIEVLKVVQGLSHLKVKIDTGRLHQIRRHLEFIGHPIMGDPKYGKGNKNRDGLKLVATALTFIDPWTKNSVTYSISSGLNIE